MKLLLDECLPPDFRHSFQDHEAHTAEWAGLHGWKNGELLRDQGIPHQQSHADRRIALIVVRAGTNQLGDLLPLVPLIVEALRSMRPGRVVVISGR